jgi:hypothetical protein
MPESPAALRAAMMTFGQEERRDPKAWWAETGKARLRVASLV